MPCAPLRLPVAILPALLYYRDPLPRSDNALLACWWKKVEYRVENVSFRPQNAKYFPFGAKILFLKALRQGGRPEIGLGERRPQWRPVGRPCRAALCGGFWPAQRPNWIIARKWLINKQSNAQLLSKSDEKKLGLATQSETRATWGLRGISFKNNPSARWKERECRTLRRN